MRCMEQTFKVRLRFMFHYHNIQERRLQAAYLMRGLRPVKGAACGCNESELTANKVQQSAVSLGEILRVVVFALHCALLRFTVTDLQIFALWSCASRFGLQFF